MWNPTSSSAAERMGVHVDMFVEILLEFDSTRRFAGMSHKKDDLELFRFVMVCNVALKSSLEV